MAARNRAMRRERNGRLQRDAELPSPNEVTRLRAASLAGMRDAVWGTMLGWLYLSGKISGAQFGAGKWFTDLLAEHAIACQSPRPPRSASLERGALGTSLDPDSTIGKLEVQAHIRTVADYLTATTVLRLTGELPSRIVMEVCGSGCAPAGPIEAEALRSGLGALAELRREPKK
jgi:hypothetical protein